MRNDLELEISHQNYSAESSIVELEKKQLSCRAAAHFMPLGKCTCLGRRQVLLVCPDISDTCRATYGQENLNLI